MQRARMLQLAILQIRKHAYKTTKELNTASDNVT